MATIIISNEIKADIAEKVAEQAAPGYDVDYMGEWYVVDGMQLMHAEYNRPWDPWNADAEVISVDDLVQEFGGADQDNADFDPSPDGDDDTVALAWERAVEFAFDYVPDSYDPAVLAVVMGDGE